MWFSLTRTHRWFHFEKIVQALVANKFYHVKTEDLRNLIEKVCKIDDEEEIMLMLDFYHDLGQIVKHGSTVVLQTQWLIDLFKQVITVPRREKQVRYKYSCFLLSRLLRTSMNILQRNIQVIMLSN